MPRASPPGRLVGEGKVLVDVADQDQPAVAPEQVERRVVLETAQAVGNDDNAEGVKQAL
ncbi:MAG: hypothetical protein WA191_01265 [Telluria sp.]|nr:hypothetical protein [Telluria sp.]